MSFEFDKTIMKKKQCFCDQGLFVLNISEVINESEFESSAYIVDSYDIWHARLGRELFVCYEIAMNKINQHA